MFLSIPMTENAKTHTSKDALRDSVLSHIFSYAKRVDTTGLSKISNYAYTKIQMKTNKRNATLTMVPTMYALAHGGGRQFVSEYYSKVTYDGEGLFKFQRILHVSTIPHRRNPMASALRFMTPNVYGENLFQENILSPFHPSNRRFYRYKVIMLPYGKVQLFVYPRLQNTQVVRSTAIVDAPTGKINIVNFEGEYDMTRFFISINMGQEGYQSLYPQKCDMRANFKFMGNRISGMYTTVYNLPKMVSDSLKNAEDTALMAKIRPIRLNKIDSLIYDDYHKRRQINDSISKNEPKKIDFVKDILWDIIGDNVFNRIKQNFGTQDQGYFRIAPLFNPLYMGYSQRKGLVYKFDVSGSYAFNKNWELYLRFRAGYSFKQKRFYYYLPASLKYNDKHEGFLRLEIGNGNRIYTNTVSRHILGISQKKDSLITMPLGDYTAFKDDYIRAFNHWSFNEKFGFELGLVTHQRKAVYPEFYKLNNYPYSFKSVAPAVALEWLPIGKKGPIFKVDYERGYKGLLGANIEYERIEMDMQAILYASRRRSYSLRLGSGFYTRKGDHWDFVDYTNFRDNNIPGGWNDEWSGEFELLNSGWYNASDYYVRSNITYEAPMFFTAWLPLGGHFIEKERLYVNSLLVRRLTPYTEWGYGFKTRLISIGIFAAFKKKQFDGVGFRWDFELFRNW